MVGESNELAYSAAKKVCGATSHYNPLFIYSAVGMGKTHLLNAIGLEIGNEKKVMFISAERFMYHFIRSIKSNEMVKFKDFIKWYINLSAEINITLFFLPISKPIAFNKWVFPIPISL